MRRRNADPGAIRARKAHREFSKAVSSLRKDTGSHAFLLEAVRRYLGDRLKLPSAALSFADVEPHLSARGIDQGILDELRELFSLCEAGSYAGNAAEGAGIEGIVERAANIIRQLDRKLS